MIKWLYNYRKYGDFMEKSGTISTDSSNYTKIMNNCKETFEGLESDWKGPSREKIKESVSSFVSEAEVVSNQLNILSQACAKYEAYVPLVKRCRELRENIRVESSKVADEDGNGGPNESLIISWERELYRNISTMKQYNVGAQNLISQINGEVKDVEIGNTDFASSVTSKA